MLRSCKKYTKIDPQAFAQMGFMAGKFATQALLNVKGADHREVVQHGGPGAEERQDGHALQAVVRRQPRRTTSRTTSNIGVTYKDGKVVLSDKCFNIAPVDKEIAQTRVWEKKFKLNTG